MKTLRFPTVWNLSLAFFLFLSLAVFTSCGKKGAEIPDADTEKTASPADSVSEKVQNPESMKSSVNSASGVSAAETSAAAQAEPEFKKTAELDAAVEEHIQAVRKQNPELEKAEAPIQMTYFFIRALQMNNEAAVNGMLTQDAYNERMKRPQSFSRPDFIKNSEVLLGSVQYLSDEKDESKIVGARVGTIWRVKNGEDVTEENIAWVFRFEDEAWLVAGMIAVLDPKYPPVLINFEDLEDTERQFQELEKEIQRINSEESSVSEKEEADTNVNSTSGDVSNSGAETPEKAVSDAASEDVPAKSEASPGALPAELPAGI